MTSPDPIGGDRVVVGPGAIERYGVPALFVAAGAGLGAALKPFAGWALSLAWVPLAGPLRLIDAVPWLPALTGGTAVGLLAGLVLAGMAADEQLFVTVDRDELTVRQGQRRVAIARTAVAAVFLDSARLVVLGHRGEELCSRSGDLPAERLGTALRRHGYRWRPEGDPYRAAYRLWVPGLPELPDGADPLLSARQRAVERGDRAEAELLRAELGRLDVVVRDEQVPQAGRRQFWRRAGP